MKEKEFLELIKNRFDYCTKLMQAKSDEYSRNTDKLHNFKRAAELERCTPERALRGMLAKHIISIYDIIDDIEEGHIPSEELFAEKFSDMINYICLLEGLIVERKKYGIKWAIAATHEGKLYKTTDGGKTWTFVGQQPTIRDVISEKEAEKEYAHKLTAKEFAEKVALAAQSPESPWISVEDAEKEYQRKQTVQDFAKSIKPKIHGRSICIPYYWRRTDPDRYTFLE